MQHDFDLIRFDSESEQCADEDSHPVDAVHMKDLAEIATDDTSFGADFLYRANRFHGIGHRLIQAVNHRLAVRSYINAEFRELLHFIQQKFVEFQQRMIERRTDAEFARFFGERQQFFEVRVSKPDPGFLGGSHFHDLNDFGQYLSGLTHQTNAASLRMSRAAPKSQRRERWKPDHLEVGVLKRDADCFGIHSQTRSGPAVNLDAMR